jgi:predicted dehydrogenase
LVDTRLPDIDVPDNVNAIYRYANGGTGVLELSWTLPGGAGFLEVYGTKGRIRMGFDGNAIQLWRNSSDSEESTIAPERCPNSQAVFRRAILGEEPSWTPGEYGRRALALCLGALESSESGAFVEIPAFPGEDAC